MTTFPAALVYYLVLVAASGLGLLAINRAVSAGNENAKPLRTTLLVVFFVQLSLLTLSLLIDDGYLPWFELFPLFFSALNFIALVWITWACVSPSGEGWRKHLPLILTLAAFLAGGLSVLFSGTQYPALTYQGTWLDLSWKAATILLLLVGMVMVLTRRRPFKLERFLVLFIASLGYLVNLSDWIASTSPLSIIFTQLLYYPLLTSLAWQTQRSSVLPSTLKPVPASPQMAEAFLELNLQSELEQIRNALTHSLSIFLMSDLLGIVELAPEGSLRVSNTYDLIREAWLPAFELAPQQAPELAAHFEDGRLLIANTPQELSEEKAALTQALGYNASGGLLLYPLKVQGQPVRYGLLGLTPYTNRAWTAEDQTRLAIISEKITQILEQAVSTEARARSAEELRISLNQLQRQNTHLREDLAHHQKLLAELRQEYVQVKNNYTKETQLWAKRQKSLEGELSNLSETLAKQAAAFAEVEALRRQKNELEDALADNAKRLARLKQTLAGAQEVLSGAALTPSSAPSSVATEGTDLLTGSQVEAALQTELEESVQSLGSRGVKLQSQIAPLPPIAENMLPTLQQVLQNLVSNAAAASPAESVISVEILPTEDSDLPESVEMRVTDQGGGLSEETQSRFLSLLEDANGDLPAEIGNPQALQQAAALVQAAGGHWWIHTEPGLSTTYRVSLPLSVQGALTQNKQKE